MRSVNRAIWTSGDPVSVSWRRCSAMMPGFARSIFSDMRDSWVCLGVGPGRHTRKAEWAAVTPERRWARIPGGRDLLKGREGCRIAVSNCPVRMRGIGRLALMGLVLIAACSGGGSGSAASTSTTTSTTSTTVASTTTTTPAEAVKAAYLDYWRILDRLAAAPDPDDAALNSRAIDPVLSSVRDDLATRRAEGRTTRIPDGAKYGHHIVTIEVGTDGAVVSDCFVDDRVQYAADGTVTNDHVSTVKAQSQLVAQGADWKISDVQLQKVADGDAGCAS